MLNLLGRIFAAPVRGCLIVSAERGCAIFELLPGIGWALLISGACQGSGPVVGLVVGGSMPVEGNLLVPLVRGFAIWKNKLARHAYIQIMTHRKIVMSVNRSEQTPQLMLFQTLCIKTCLTKDQGIDVHHTKTLDEKNLQYLEGPAA